MGKIVVAGVGGPGSGSDDCTALKDDLLKGTWAITADSDDEVAEGTLELAGNAADSQVLAEKTYYNTNPKKKKTGTMPNRGAAKSTLNAGGSYTIAAGYHNGGGKVTANSLASQTPGNASGGHILSGYTAWVNGQKVPGGIPIQNAETDNDRVWATKASNWAGTFNIGVRNGHYLNGVNWIRYDVPNYQPWNIKKGVNIGGVVGTFSGYVPTATDLYLRGQNLADFSGNNSGEVRLDAGQMTIVTTGDCKIHFTVNFTGYTYINFQGYTSSSDTFGRSISFSGHRVDVNHGQGNYTVSINVSAYQTSGGFWLRVYNLPGAIYRIWLS